MTHAPPEPTPAQAYVAMLFAALETRDPREVLTQTPDILRAEVAGLSPLQLTRPEAPGKWSILQVVQHLADSELVGGFRFRMIVAHDRPSLPGYDQDLWVTRLRYQESSLEDALGEFTTLRWSNVRLFDRLSPTELTRAMLHSERGEESLDKMRRMYAGHDLVHLRQVTRIRATMGEGVRQ